MPNVVRRSSNYIYFPFNMMKSNNYIILTGKTTKER